MVLRLFGWNVCGIRWYGQIWPFLVTCGEPGGPEPLAPVRLCRPRRNQDDFRPRPPARSRCTTGRSRFRPRRGFAEGGRRVRLSKSKSGPDPRASSTAKKNTPNGRRTDWQSVLRPTVQIIAFTRLMSAGRRQIGFPRLFVIFIHTYSQSTVFHGNSSGRSGPPPSSASSPPCSKSRAKLRHKAIVFHIRS